ncbi:MAG: WYL domain-containing protein [Xanthomonadales bacterium]|nr:WYL domain-containing protein [Xanthomonadales bacterium]
MATSTTHRRVSPDSNQARTTGALAEELVEFPLGTDQELEEAGEDRWLVTVTARNDTALIDWILSNGPSCVVIEPKHLADDLHQTIEQIIREYEDRDRVLNEMSYRRERREFDVDHFWISNHNELQAIQQPHWSYMLRHPKSFDLTAEKAAGMGKKQLEQWAIDRHWIAISRTRAGWNARTLKFDKHIRELLSQWVDKMRELGLMDSESKIDILISKTDGHRSLSANDLLD